MAESLHDTVQRVLPFWNDSIAPALSRDRSVLVAAHGNSLRGLIKYLDRISDAELVDLDALEMLSTWDQMVTMPREGGEARALTLVSVLRRRGHSFLL